MTRNEIKEFKEAHWKDFLDLVSQKAGYQGIEDAIDQGVPANELQPFSEEANRELWGSEINDGSARWSLREHFYRLLNEKFGDFHVYLKSDKVVEHRLSKMQATMLQTYGVINPGQLMEHRKSLMKGESGCSNPFASTKFRYLEYIKGKSPKPEDREDYSGYYTKVWRLTKQHLRANEVPLSDTCYYTGIKIHKNKSKFNDYNFATIDHKTSVLDGYYKGWTPEQVADPSNLVWCAKYFNTLKGCKSEFEVELSGLAVRFREVWDKIYEDQIDSEG